jgi:predicted ABC-type transport system involved in lysophospholipase L1 biosynthesis ATPase subunit
LQIAGLLDVADAGAIYYASRAMTNLGDSARTEARRQEVGFIYQFHHLLPEFSALENITLPQLANGVARREADARSRDLLGRVGVLPRADHRPAAGRSPIGLSCCWPMSRRATSTRPIRRKSLMCLWKWCVKPACPP